MLAASCIEIEIEAYLLPCKGLHTGLVLSWEIIAPMWIICLLLCKIIENRNKMETGRQSSDMRKELACLIVRSTLQNNILDKA